MERLLDYDRGRVLADLACAIGDGAVAISDFRVIGDQHQLFGLVASVPAGWRALAEIAGGGERALHRVTAAVNAARRSGVGITARPGARPGVQVADKVVDGVTCIRPDGSVVTCDSDKEFAEANFQGSVTARRWLTLTIRARRCWNAARRSARCRRRSGAG